MCGTLQRREARSGVCDPGKWKRSQQCCLSCKYPLDCRRFVDQVWHKSFLGKAAGCRFPSTLSCLVLCRTQTDRLSMSLPGVWLTPSEHFAWVLLDVPVKIILLFLKTKLGNAIFMGAKPKILIIFLCFRVENRRRGTCVFV